jgi:hypothetical protein
MRTPTSLVRRAAGASSIMITPEALLSLVTDVIENLR